MGCNHGIAVAYLHTVDFHCLPANGKSAYCLLIPLIAALQPEIYADSRQNIQDYFNEAEIEIKSKKRNLNDFLT